MDIKSMIAQKQSKNANKKLTIQDINHDLIVSLFAVSVYGKPARDEDILNIIIGNAQPSLFERIKKEYEERKKSLGKLTRRKDGMSINSDGFIILIPR